METVFMGLLSKGHLRHRFCQNFIESYIMCRSQRFHGSSHSPTNLNLHEARQHWTNLSKEQMSKSVYRDLTTVPEKFTDQLSDTYVRTCRVLCTDRYIPFEQVQLKKFSYVSNKHCNRPSRSLDYGTNKHHDRPRGSFDYDTIEQVSGLPVEISWQEIDDSFNNAITVGDAQEALSESDIAAYGFDLLRVHLVAQATGPRSDPFYFALENFVELSSELKQWLSSISNMAAYLNSLSHEYVDGPEFQHKRLIVVMNEYKRSLRGLLIAAWYPGYALHRMQEMTATVQKHLVTKGDASQEMYRALREICIMVNILAPFTASKVWGILQSNTKYTAKYEEQNQCLTDQMWPASHDKFDTQWPFIVSILDSDGMIIHYQRSMRSADLLDKLDEDIIKQIALKSPKYQNHFGDLNLEVEDVSWHVSHVGTVVKAKVIVKSSAQLTERLSQLRI